ncbi:MAG: hypothetical protein R3F59_31995 [Myxococcota bacterium]
MAATIGLAATDSLEAGARRAPVLRASLLALLALRGAELAHFALLGAIGHALAVGPDAAALWEGGALAALAAGAWLGIAAWSQGRTSTGWSRPTTPTSTAKMRWVSLT